MKKLLLLCVFLSSLAIQMSAQSRKDACYEKITLKDGSVLSGYLKSQDIAVQHNVSPKIEIYVYSMERIIPGALIKGEIAAEQKVLSNLDDSWKRWFREHRNLIQRRNGREVVVMDRIHLSKALAWGEMSDLVKVIESGYQTKYIDFPQKTFEVEAAMVEKIEYLQEGKSKKSLPETIHSRKDGTVYVGQVAYLKPGRTLGMYLSESPYRLTNINMADILSRKKGDADMNDQYTLLDKVETINDGEYTGIIQFYFYGTATEKAYVTLIQRDGNQKQIPMLNIKRIVRLGTSGSRPAVPSQSSEPEGRDVTFSIAAEDTPEQEYEPAPQEEIPYEAPAGKDAEVDIPLEAPADTKSKEPVIQAPAVNIPLEEAKKAPSSVAEPAQSPASGEAPARAEEVVLVSDREVLINNQQGKFSQLVKTKDYLIVQHEDWIMDLSAEGLNQDVDVCLRRSSMYSDVVLIKIDRVGFPASEVKPLTFEGIPDKRLKNSDYVDLYAVPLLEVSARSFSEIKMKNDVVKRIYKLSRGVYGLYSPSNQQISLIRIK